MKFFLRDRCAYLGDNSLTMACLKIQYPNILMVSWLTMIFPSKLPFWGIYLVYPILREIHIRNESNLWFIYLTGIRYETSILWVSMRYYRL